jgi:hypothetical protein
LSLHELLQARSRKLSLGEHNLGDGHIDAMHQREHMLLLLLLLLLLRTSMRLLLLLRSNN